MAEHYRVDEAGLDQIQDSQGAGTGKDQDIPALDFEKTTRITGVSSADQTAQLRGTHMGDVTTQLPQDFNAGETVQMAPSSVEDHDQWNDSDQWDDNGQWGESDYLSSEDPAVMEYLDSTVLHEDVEETRMAESVASDGSTDGVVSMLPVTRGRSAKKKPQEDDEQSFTLFGRTFTISGGLKGKLIVGAIVVAGIVAIGLGVLALHNMGVSHQAALEEASRVSTAEAVSEDFELRITGSATAYPIDQADVIPQVSGTVSELYVSEGSEVSEGDLVAHLTSSSIEAAVSQAESSVSQAQETVSSREEAVNSLSTSYQEMVKKQAEAKAKAIEEAIKKATSSSSSSTSTSTATIDESSITTEYDSQVKELEAQVATAISELDSANTALQQAQDELSYAQGEQEKLNVYAPMTGTIVSLDVESGTSYSVDSGSIATVADLSQFVVDSQFSESNMAYLAEGQFAEISFEGLGDQMAYAYLASISDVPSDSDGGTSYSVDFVIEDPPEGLRVGMTGTITVIAETIEGATVIPSNTLYTSNDGGYYVNVVTTYSDGGGQHVTPTYVRVLSQHDGKAAVEGINAGDQLEILS